MAKKNWKTRGQNRLCLEVSREWGAGDRGEGGRRQGGEVAQTMYIHMNKYKNNLKSFSKICKIQFYVIYIFIAIFLSFIYSHVHTLFG
jgi:hypothetical protein